MPWLRHEEIDRLVRTGDAPAVSLYLPTVRAGRDTRQNPVRFGNLLREATDRLGKRGDAGVLRERLEERGRALLEDTGFWQHQDEGLAVFASAGDALAGGEAVHGLHVLRLPEPPESLAYVGERFYTRPLYALLGPQERLYVLALSRNRVRLIEVTADEGRVCDPPDLPAGLDDALRYDDPEVQLQTHTLGGAAAGRAGSVLYHGQGAGHDSEDVDTLRFCRAVDRALHGFFAGGRPRLLLACVKELAATYRRANTCAEIPEALLAGNPDERGADALAEAAREQVAARDDPARDAVHAFREPSRPELASDRVEHVVPAALVGRVDTLFVARDQHVWGRVEPGSGQVVLDDAGDELGDAAAAATWSHGGSVHVLPRAQMPTGAPLAALLRW